MSGVDMTHIYRVSGNTYKVANAEALLEQVKNSNPETKGMTLKEYIGSTAKRLQEQSSQTLPDSPLASDIVEVWKNMGIAQELTNGVSNGMEL